MAVTPKVVESCVDTESFVQAMQKLAEAMRPVVEYTNIIANWYWALPLETRDFIESTLFEEGAYLDFESDEGPGLTLAELLGEIDAELEQA